VRRNRGEQRRAAQPPDPQAQYTPFVELAGSDQVCFVYFDGDDVGACLELHLLRGEVDQSAAVSAAVVRAVGNIADSLRNDFRGNVVFAAGDEVLGILPVWPHTDDIHGLCRLFERSTGMTISCGLGNDAAEAARNLRMAKLRGKNCVHGGKFA
jgi:hypothetical protein